MHFLPFFFALIIYNTAPPITKSITATAIISTSLILNLYLFYYSSAVS